MIGVKKWIYLACACLLTSCFVPGTYYSEDTISQGYVVDGKREQIKVQRLDAQWLESHQPNSNNEYTVGPYDILNIIVWGHPELTTPSTQLSNPSESGILVDSEGSVTFPFAGKVHVSGLTLNEVQSKLEDKIKVYINNPQVSIRVAQFRSKEAYIVGEVGSQGLQPITDRPLSVMQAIELAGGVNLATANTRNIYILRQNKSRLEVYWFNAQDPLQLSVATKFQLINKDIVYVPPAGISGWNRVVGQLIPTATTANTLGGSYA